MKHIQSSNHLGRKHKEAFKSNEFNLANNHKQINLESPTQYTYDSKGMKGMLNSFRPQLMINKKNNEIMKDKENNQINIKFNFNSEIINDNYTPHDSSDYNSNRKLKNNDSNAKIKTNSKSKDKIIKELQGELAITQSLLMKVQHKEIKDFSPSYYDQKQDNKDKYTDELKGTNLKYPFPNLLNKTKSSLSLSLCANNFFQNLMKNSQTLSKTIMRKRRLMSPKCNSSTSMNFDKNSRANSPLSTHSVKSGKHRSMRQTIKKKFDNNFKEEPIKKLKSINKRMEMLFQGYNSLCLDHFNDNEYNKQKYPQSKQRVLFQNYFK